MSDSVGTGIVSIEVCSISLRLLVFNRCFVLTACRLFANLPGFH